jgi:hypothetical protein
MDDKSRHLQLKTQRFDLDRKTRKASALPFRIMVLEEAANRPRRAWPIQARVLATVLAVTAAVAVLVASPRSLLHTEPAAGAGTALLGLGRGIRLVHLPGGKVEMEYAGGSQGAVQQQQQQQQQQQLAGARFGPYAGGELGAARGVAEGFAPESAAIRQAYKFAEENRPSVTRAFDRRSYGVEQAHLRGRSFDRVRGGSISQALPAGNRWAPNEYKSLQAKLDAIHKDQQQQAIAGQAESGQLAFMTDPTILSNELMQQAAGVIVHDAKAERAHSRAFMMIKSRAAAALSAKKSGKSAELKAKALALKAVESSVLQGRSQSKGVTLEAPARMMSLAEEPSGAATPADLAVSPGEGGKIQAAIPPVPSGGDGCAGGVLCAIPTNNVAIQALEARLQADEIAISTLTSDVSELTKQTEELQKPLPLPPGAKPA